MDKSIETIIEIQNTSSVNNKINILRANSNNETLRQLLKVAFDPNITTNIGAKKLAKSINLDTKKFSDINLLMDFATNSTGKDIDIKVIQNSLATFDSITSDILSKIITKTLSIGMNVKNINKAIPNLIPSFQPMLAYNIEKYLGTGIEDNIYYATMKLDGNRCLIKVDDEITAYSRTGLKEEYLNNFLSKLNLSSGYYYDGELLPTGMNDCNSKEKYRKISELMRSKTEKSEELCYHIFDMIPISEFDNGKSNKTYKQRREILNTLSNTEHQQVVEVLYVGNINDELWSLLHKVTAEGNEGLMINLSDGVYEGKRSKNILKLKTFHDIDLLCTNTLEGSGKFKNKLGSIEVSYKGNTVAVSGFPDALREYYWKHPEEIVGKIVKISYFHETQNKDGHYSLRHPNFLEVRNDKADISYE